MPTVRQQFNHPPAVIRAPLAKWSSLSPPPPKRTVVPGAPRAPVTPGGATTGPVVTSGGTEAPWVHHIRYSALTQNRPARVGQSTSVAQQAGSQPATGAWQPGYGWGATMSVGCGAGAAAAGG